MGRFLVVVTALGALASCSDKKKTEGLPPAQEWGAGPSGAASPGGAMVQMPAGGGANPHKKNPHEGVPGAPDLSDQGGGDMGGAPDMGGGPDVAKMGLPPPDPGRPIDPTHHVKGLIKVHPKAAMRASAGGAVFVIVKKSDASGQPSGPPLAVEKLTWQKDGLPFELTEAQAMIGGTQLVGDVIVTARYDQDGDALSKQPGDIVGQVRVTIPADNVNLFLDEVLP